MLTLAFKVTNYETALEESSNKQILFVVKNGSSCFDRRETRHAGTPLAPLGCVGQNYRIEGLTHFCPPFHHLLSEKLMSLGIMGAPRVPPLNPSETIVL